MMNYGEFIKMHRIKSGYKSQRSFAEATGISPATISRIEDGKHRPAPETIQAFAKKLHTTSLVELMVVCGYWNEEDLLEPIDMSGVENSSDTYISEKEFLEKLELSDEELLDKFELTLDGKPLTKEEAKGIIAYLRSLRQLGEKSE